jgi:transposase
LGGVPERGIYDNMKTAVDKVGKGNDRTINKRFLAMASHYLFEPEFCNPAAGWEKGQVEKSVRDARQRLFHNAPNFDSLAELNRWLEHRCKALWSDIPHPEFKQQTIQDVWQEEKPLLMPMSQAFQRYWIG